MRGSNGKVAAEVLPASAHGGGERLVGDLAALADRAERAARREQLAREELYEAHAQLAERDDQIALLIRPGGRAGEDLFSRLVEQREQLSAELAATRELLGQTEARLSAVTSTRAWRVVCAWWGLRSRIRGY